MQLWELTLLPRTFWNNEDCKGNRMIEYKVKNKFKAVPIESVQIKGYAGNLIDKFFYGRIFSDYARQEVYPEAEDAF